MADGFGANNPDISTPITESPHVRGIYHKVGIINNLYGSKHPQDILQLKQLAENIKEEADLLILEFEENRKALIRELGGKHD